MASTYSTNLKIELMGSGDQVGAWGATTNDNLGVALEEAIVGRGAVQFTNDANLTLSLSDSNASQLARNFYLDVTSTVSLSTQRDLIVPTIEKTYTVYNNTTGSQAIRVKTSAGTGVVVPSGKKMVLYADGTNVIEQVDYITTLAIGTLTVNTPLPVTSGGTGLTTLTANNVILGNGTSNPQFVAPGTAKNTLTSNGTTWVSESPFTTGMIMLWSGSIASIPSGWALCNGTSGTPDLRNRFVVGAGDTYAVGATGGATTVTLSTSNLPAHTHSFSGSGTTSGQSQGHVHGISLTTGLQSNDHVHGYSGTTDTQGTHLHAIQGNEVRITPQQGSEIVMRGAGGAATSWNSDTAGAHAHNFSGTTGGISANHNHSVSGNSNINSVDHTHTYSFSGTTGSTGSGSSFSILPPYYALAYIMKL